MPLLQPIVTLLVGLASIAISIGALVVGLRSLRGSIRPMLRAVRARPDRPTNISYPDRLLVKNIGRGWALSVKVVALADRRHRILGELDAVEPLGPKGAGGESERAGRRIMNLDPEWAMGDNEVYRLIYQDIDGRWHESRFTFHSDRDFQVKFLGGVPSWSLPRAVRETATVIEPRI